MTINRDNISHIHWQLKCDHDKDCTGDIVFGLDDLAQEIRTLILTPKGSVPLNPEKGCDIYPYIDRPAEHAIPHITREIFDCLDIWCKRIEVEEVKVSAIAFHHYKFEVMWRPKEAIIDEIFKTEIIFKDFDVMEVA